MRSREFNTHRKGRETCSTYLMNSPVWLTYKRETDIVKEQKLLRAKEMTERYRKPLLSTPLRDIAKQKRTLTLTTRADILYTDGLRTSAELMAKCRS